MALSFTCVEWVMWPPWKAVEKTWAIAAVWASSVVGSPMMAWTLCPEPSNRFASRSHSASVDGETTWAPVEEE